MSHRPVVVKVGGSLLGEPHLNERLQTWVKTQASTQVVFLTGGGALAKALRQRGGMDDEKAHWVSIGFMRDHTRFLSYGYPGGRVVRTWTDAVAAWGRGEQPFFDVRPFLKLDDKRKNHLPHTWDVSSDSIAARLASRHEANLVLLKTCPVSAGPYDWDQLARHGVVDVWFPRVAAEVREIRLANLPPAT